MNTDERIFDRDGRRKFLTREERAVFLDSVHELPAERRTFCLTIAYTGCRLPEACEITVSDIDLGGEAVFIGSRHDRRGVPVPREVLFVLDAVHGILRALEGDTGARDRRLWPIDRTTASRWLKDAMNKADIVGPHANAKGLRHAFALEHLEQGVQPQIVQRWLGRCDQYLLSAYQECLHGQSAEPF